MTIENQNAAGETAPESVSTAAVEDVNTQTPEETQEPRTFTQEELDKIIAKEKAKERRRLEREFTQQVQEAQPPATQDAPKPDQFRTPEEYAEAYAEWKFTEQQARQQRQQVDSTFEDRAEEARAKYDDFDDVVKNPNLRITEAMAVVIKESEMGPDIAYHLGTNPKEAERISRLAPLAQAREIGKIEVSLSSNPPVVKKTSSAPDPIRPVNSRSSTPKYDPTDPRSTSTMSTSEWIKARNEQIAKQHAR